MDASLFGMIVGASGVMLGIAAILDHGRLGFGAKRSRGTTGRLQPITNTVIALLEWSVLALPLILLAKDVINATAYWWAMGVLVGVVLPPWLRLRLSWPRHRAAAI